FDQYSGELNRHFNISAFSPGPGQFATAFEDITERKRADETLRLSEERLRTVLENMPVLLVANDAEGGLLIWNRECERVTGYSAEEIIGNPRVGELLFPNSE